MTNLDKFLDFVDQRLLVADEEEASHWFFIKDEANSLTEYELANSYSDIGIGKIYSKLIERNRIRTSERHHLRSDEEMAVWDAANDDVRINTWGF